MIRPLLLVLAAAAAVALAWSIVLPPFQGPDESEHFAYVQHLAETGKAPSWNEQGGAGSHSSEETYALHLLGLRMLMATNATRPDWNELALDRWNAFERDAGHAQRADGEGPNPIGKNPPLYYAYGAVAYHASPGKSLFARLFATRLASILLFLATVALTWLAVAELTQRTWVRTLAAALVAVQPQLAFTGAISNADIMLVTVWTAFVALAIRTLRRGPSAPRVLGLFALTAASALTHGRGLALLPALAIVVALAYWRHRPAWRPALRWTGAGLLVLAAGLVVFRLFTASGGAGGGSLYGNQTTYLQQTGFDLVQFVSQAWQFYLPALPGMKPPIGPGYGFRQLYFETFFGAFGWLEIRFPDRVYSTLRLGAIVGLALLVFAAWRRRALLRAEWHVALGLVAVAVSLIGLLHLVSYLALLGGPDPLIVGRYLLPLVSLYAIAIAFVVTALPRLLGAAFAGALVVSGIVLQLGGIGMALERFYA